MGDVVVVTGAAGCIGFHTVKLLLERDERVTEIRCLDLRKPDSKFREKLDSIANSRRSSSLASKIDSQSEADQDQEENHIILSWNQGDIRDINLVESLLEGAHCVIHAAAKIDAWIHWAHQDVSELYSVNVEGTENLLRACQRMGVTKFIHVSSFETYISFDTIYYATENTLPQNRSLLFGASAQTKLEAEMKVRQYANVKLNNNNLVNDNHNRDQLLAVIVRFSTVYGEYDAHYVSKILQLTKFFNGKLQRFTNVWIRQQSIYAGNAAWSLIKAKQRLDHDLSISGEEFHITDDTEIQDPFDFVEPYLECRGMHVTKETYPFIPSWILLWLFFAISNLISKLDLFGLFTKKKSRYQEAIDEDNNKKIQNEDHELKESSSRNSTNKNLHWYSYVMPQTLFFMCNSSFLNRTKASLRLDYEPIFTNEEAKERSLNWYKNELEL